MRRNLLKLFLFALACPITALGTTKTCGAEGDPLGRPGPFVNSQDITWGRQLVPNDKHDDLDINDFGYKSARTESGFQIFLSKHRNFTGVASHNYNDRADPNKEFVRETVGMLPLKDANLVVGQMRIIGKGFGSTEPILFGGEVVEVQYAKSGSDQGQPTHLVLRNSAGFDWLKDQSNEGATVFPDGTVRVSLGRVDTLRFTKNEIQPPLSALDGLSLVDTGIKEFLGETREIVGERVLAEKNRRMAEIESINEIIADSGYMLKHITPEGLKNGSSTLTDIQNNHVVVISANVRTGIFEISKGMVTLLRQTFKYDPRGHFNKGQLLGLTLWTNTPKAIVVTFEFAEVYALVPSVR